MPTSCATAATVTAAATDMVAAIAMVASPARAQAPSDDEEPPVPEPVAEVHGEAPGRSLADGQGIALRRAGALENVDVEGGEVDQIEAHRPAAMRHRPGEMRARPVEHRHEIVGNNVYSTGSEITDGYFVVLDILFKTGCLCFDALMNRHTFHHRPYHTGGFHFGFSFIDLFQSPYFPIGYMVQSCYHAAASGLSYIR